MLSLKIFLASCLCTVPVAVIHYCNFTGVHCPAIYYVDMDTNTIYMEHLKDSITVKDYIMERTADGVDRCMDTLQQLAIAIGQVVGMMHRNHIIHGDLTTSNLLLVGKPEDCHIAVIDFGLASIEETAEDKGVDLYVLERALLSTHPSTEPLFEAILHSYKETYMCSSGSSGRGNRGGTTADEVLKKFDQIRLRGRKRNMVG